MFRTLSQIQWSYEDCSVAQKSSAQKLKFKAGDRLPYVVINKESVYNMLRAPVFHLLVISNSTILFPATEFVKPVFLGMEEWKTLGVKKPLYILVRPDNYIGLIADEMSKDILNKYLKEHCHFADVYLV